MLQPIASSRVLAQPIFGSYPFTLGVASGDPWPDGVVLWTRLAPEPLDGGGMPTASVEVGWEVARDRAFRTIAQKGTAIARPELGHSVHVEVDGPRSPGASTGIASAPAARSARSAARRPRRRRRRRRSAALRACAAAATTRRATSPRSDGIADERFDFVFHTGDYIYEGAPTADAIPRSSGSTTARRSTRSSTIATATRCTRSDRDLIAAHASAPFVMTWDDHEVDNDYAGDRDEHDTPPEVFLLRRAAAYQAYYETMPLAARRIADRPEHADVSPAAVRHADRHERARHASVPQRPGVRRRRRHRLRRGRRSGADDARRRAGAMAVRATADARARRGR